MSCALTTLVRVSYCLRKFWEAAMSSAWKLQVAEPDNAGPLSSKAIARASNVGRWFVGVLARRQFVGRPFHDLLEQEMHEQEQRLGFEHQENCFVLGIVVEMLMDATVLDDHHVAGLPGDVPAIVHVMAAALEHVEHRAVEVAVLLAVGLGRVGLDMRFHRLDNAGRLRADHALAELAGAALPRHLAGRIDPLLLEQRLVEVTVGAFQRAHEGALLVPALPLLVLLLLGIFVGLVVTNARPYLIVHARHCGPPFESVAACAPPVCCKRAVMEPCAVITG